jgi:hypothetical protein
MKKPGRLLFQTLLVLALPLLVASCGRATTDQAALGNNAVEAKVLFGTVDTVHDNVALLVAFAEDGRALFRCTGTLVDENTVLTAGHCVSDPELAYVRAYFVDSTTRNELFTVVNGVPYDKEQIGYVGEPIPHPLYIEGGFPNTHDIGVVELEQNVVGIEPATIAPEGYLDSLATERGKQETSFTISGFGVQGVKPVAISQYTRYMGTVQLVNLRSALTGGWNVQLTSSPGKGTGPGGLCFGDSGGAVFHEDDIIVAVNSFVLNLQCRGSGFSYRVDTDDAQDFLADYVTGITAD